MLPDGKEHSFVGSFKNDGEKLSYKSKISRDGGDAKPYGWNYRDAN
jgi:hypothetical protein